MRLREATITFFKQQLEKLIEDIPTHLTKTFARGNTVISIPTEKVKQQLRDKWL